MAGQSWTHHNIGRLIIFAAKKIILESGFAQYLNVAPCNESTFRPANLFYNAEVSAYMSTPTPLQGEIQTSVDAPFFVGQDLPERQTLSTGCKTKVLEISRCDVTFTELTPTYCDSDEIRRRKNVQLKIKPSIFTGKTQLLVQALYGSNRSDYEINEDYQYLDPPFVFDGEVIGYKQSPFTSGLLTTADYRYFLINVGSSVTAKELNPSPEGLKLRDHLSLHSLEIDVDTISKVEAYILSTCKISNDTLSIDIDMSSVIGSAIAYGWHFNWDGDTANIILHRDNLPTDQAHHAYHYQLSFSFNDETSEISASLTELFSNKLWYSVTNKLVLAPDYLTGYMAAFVNPKATPFSGWNINSNWASEIYCYYDNEDVLRFVSVGNTHSASSSVGARTFGICGAQSGDVVRSIGAFTRPASNASFVEISGGERFDFDAKQDYVNTTVEFFRFTGQTGYEMPYPVQVTSMTGSNRALPNSTLTSSICGGQSMYNHAVSSGFLVPPYIVGSITSEIVTKPDGTTTNPAVTYNSRRNTCHYYRNNNASQTKYVMHQVLIPFHDCSYASIAEKSRISESRSSQTQLWKNGFTDAEVVYGKWFFHAGEQLTIGVSGPHAMTATRIFNQAVGTDNTGAFSEDNITVQFADSSGIIFTDSPSSFDAYSTYFDVDYVTSPEAIFNAAHFSSITGASKTEISGLLTIDGGYIYDTSIGWA